MWKCPLPPNQCWNFRLKFNAMAWNDADTHSPALCLVYFADDLILWKIKWTTLFSLAMSPWTLPPIHWRGCGCFRILCILQMIVRANLLSDNNIFAQCDIFIPNEIYRLNHDLIISSISDLPDFCTLIRISLTIKWMLFIVKSIHCRNTYTLNSHWITEKGCFSYDENKKIVLIFNLYKIESSVRMEWHSLLMVIYQRRVPRIFYQHW